MTDRKTSPKVAKVASRGLHDPASLSDGEVQSLSASALAQVGNIQGGLTPMSANNVNAALANSYAWKLTGALRWYQVAAFARPVLQQEYQSPVTYETRWETIPTFRGPK